MASDVAREEAPAGGGRRASELVLASVARWGGWVVLLE